MNQENLKKLIEIIENKKNPFNWGNTRMCLGFYAKRLTDKMTTGSQSLSEVLDINLDDARNLYVAIDFKTGKEITCPFGSVGINNEKHREKALEYLRSFLTEE